MTYSGVTKYLMEIESKLQELEIPVFFKLPDDSVQEPFLVVYSPTSNAFLTAQTGVLIEDVELLIHIYLPGNDRLNAEEVRAKAMRLIGRDFRMTSQLEFDNTIGREVYRIIMRASKLIM